MESTGFSKRLLSERLAPEKHKKRYYRVRKWSETNAYGKKMVLNPVFGKKINRSWLSTVFVTFAISDREFVKSFKKKFLSIF